MCGGSICIGGGFSGPGSGGFSGPGSNAERGDCPSISFWIFVSKAPRSNSCIRTPLSDPKNVGVFKWANTTNEEIANPCAIPRPSR
jgi:hypothetical protein